MPSSDKQWIPDKSGLDQWWEDFWRMRNTPFGPPSKHLLPIIQREVMGAKEALRSIDIASGDGRYAIPMAEMGCLVTALEWTQSGAATIKKRAAESGVPVEIEVADYRLECLTPRCYDLLVCSGLLEEIDQSCHEDAIVGFSTWTKPGGLALIKYCHEIQDRGILVPEDFVAPLLERQGMIILEVKENDILKKSVATGVLKRTGTVIARRPE